MHKLNWILFFIQSTSSWSRPSIEVKETNNKKGLGSLSIHLGFARSQFDWIYKFKKIVSIHCKIYWWLVVMHCIMFPCDCVRLFAISLIGSLLWCAMHSLAVPAKLVYVVFPSSTTLGHILNRLNILHSSHRCMWHILHPLQHMPEMRSLFGKTVIVLHNWRQREMVNQSNNVYLLIFFRCTTCHNTIIQITSLRCQNIHHP